jgi:hypothetical protein
MSLGYILVLKGLGDMSTERKSYVIVDSFTREVSFAQENPNGITLFNFNGGYNSTDITVPEFQALPKRDLFFPTEPIPEMEGTVITRADLGI